MKLPVIHRPARHAVEHADLMRSRIGEERIRRARNGNATGDSRARASGGGNIDSGDRYVSGAGNRNTGMELPIVHVRQGTPLIV